MFLCLNGFVQAQVGIGVINPQETLHIQGDLIVEGFNELDNSTSLVGADIDGNLTLLNIDNQLTLENNTLQLASSISYGIGTMDLSGLIVPPGNQVHNMDLQLGQGEANQGKVVIKVFNLPSNIKITGMEDGVDGLHVFFYHSGVQSIMFLDESDTRALSSLPNNRIKVLAGSETISAEGSIELIYDGVLQRWLFLSIHD
ncbi:hypothetical protein [Patiriisocius sp. Uisw_017]|uniref:hypothetical protein n=1 Tax=Patiriisocius sp. Uisw_017 TaxID=3230968 RepID=UPI0039EB0823